MTVTRQRAADWYVFRIHPSSLFYNLYTIRGCETVQHMLGPCPVVLGLLLSEWPVVLYLTMLHIQVVIGVGDPNPLVAAQGIAILEDAGIEVCTHAVYSSVCCLLCNHCSARSTHARSEEQPHRIQK